MVSKTDFALTKKEEQYYRRHKKLIDAIVSAWDSMRHSGCPENGKFQTAFLTLENSLGKELILKLVRKKFWDDCDRAEKEVAKWPEWKRTAVRQVLENPVETDSEESS
jgi:hypothetical protein